MITVNGTLADRVGHFSAVWIEVKDLHNESVEFEFGPLNGSNNAFSIASLQAVKMIIRDSGSQWTRVETITR